MEALYRYEQACEDLKEGFLESLYPEGQRQFVGDAWVANNIGGLLMFNDYFVDMNDIAGHFRDGTDPKTFFEEYDRNNQ